MIANESTDGPDGASGVAPFHQCAFVVDDLDRALTHWTTQLRVGPWHVWSMGPPTLRDGHYRGEPADFSLRHALAWDGHMQVELVQPLSGPSIFTDHLQEFGPGFHHIGRVVRGDHATAVADHRTRGFELLQGARGFGASKDGAFAYLMPPEGHAVIELIFPPSRRFPPEAVHVVDDEV